MPKEHIFINLNPAELTALQDFMKQMAIGHNFRARLRGNAVWISSQQHKTVEEIARSLDKSTRMVYSWLRRYREKGVEGLKDYAGKLTAEQISQIMEVSRRSKPIKHGREKKARWSYRRIAGWVKDNYGVSISHERLRQIIRRRLLNP